MADLGSGTVGQARRQANRNPAAENIPVSTTPEPARLRGPREILKERERKEALRRLQEEEQNRRGNGRTYDQAAGVGDSGGEGTSAEKRRRAQQVNPAQARNTTRSGDNTGAGGATQVNETQPLPTAAARAEARAAARDSGAQGASQPVPQTSTRTERTSARQNVQVSQQPRVSSGAEATTRQQTSGANQPRNSSTTTFPHAFERWETLSSHWEGLTSFWIKRLQGNSEELNGQHINQQLARQVTDLSAAGANLFHAVVELQRLRASSERKFQRWFFEVRDDQEKTAEKMARLEADLVAARQERPPQPAAPAAPSPEEIRKQAEELAAAEIEKIKRQCALEIKEKNRELDISREEARRGWEEIGRLEQRDRDRTFSLRRGEPTVLGGVQVVPFQSEGSRHVRGQSGGLSQHPPEGTTSNYAPGYDTRRSETDTDPFVEGPNEGQNELFGMATTARQPDSAAARTRGASASPARPRTAGQPFPSSSVHATNPTTSSVPSAAFYKQSGAETTLHQTPTRGPVQENRSYATSEHSEDDDYEVDATGRVVRDLQGNPVGQRTNPSSEISDEYDVLEQMEQNQLFSAGLPGNYGPTQYTTSNGGSYQAPDYTGAGYGGREWEGVPQHHHPSRLSNILEEDERSRTSETSRRVPH